MTAPESIEAVAEAVLAEHRLWSALSVPYSRFGCACQRWEVDSRDWPKGFGDRGYREHNTHVAQALATALAAREQDAPASAWQECRPSHYSTPVGHPGASKDCHICPPREIREDRR